MFKAASQGEPRRSQKFSNTHFTSNKVESVCPKLETLFLRQTYQTIWKISSLRPSVWPWLGQQRQARGAVPLLSQSARITHRKAAAAATVTILTTLTRWPCSGDPRGHFH